MNSNVKGVLFVVLGILSLLWLAYDVIGYASRGGVAPGDNPALEYTMTFLKLVMTISWFFNAFRAFQQKG
jgi:uncharacterized membrane protein YecN with MAPEG domain